MLGGTGSVKLSHMTAIPRRTLLVRQPPFVIRAPGVCGVQARRAGVGFVGQPQGQRAEPPVQSPKVTEALLAIPGR